MGKKNPFVTTIGFNKHDSAHVEVAQLLNSMERGKAQYIVDAVQAYRTFQENGQTVFTGTAPDYGEIRRFVLQVIDEHEREKGNPAETAPESWKEPQETAQQDFMTGLDDETVSGIMSSLEAFKG